MEDLSRANSLFALDLYRRLSASNAEENVFFSPLSISTALSMVYLGVRGDTAKEMAKVLSLSSVSDVHSHFKTLTSTINRPSTSYILRLANRLFGEKTLNFLPEYLHSILKLYHTELQALDFIGAPEMSRQLINKWVEEQTENKIKDLLKRGAVNETTQLVLVNAIYFKGCWIQTFDTRDTQEMPFKINQNESRPVKMMYQKDIFPFRYIPEYELQVLELPYKKFKLSMLILLPKKTQDDSDSLLKLESELTIDKLLDWTKRDNMVPRMEVKVHLPKFKLEFESYLLKILQEMAVSSVMEGLFCANGLFALDLYRALSASNAEKNMFLSISAALSMIYLGARGDTAKEMAKVLSFSSVSDVHSHFKTLTSTINRPSASYILKLANRLFGEKTFSLFALDLYRALSANNAEENVFFSPLSISAALSMVYLGARGDTAKEMAKVLSFSSVSDVHSHFKTLTSTINRPSATYILKLANRLYGEKTFNFLPEYLDSILKLYHTELQAVDFIGASEMSRQLINKWVEEQTENKIKDLLKRGAVNETTQLVLVNAIYFKGTWMDTFDPKDTHEMPFKINQNESRPVKMMYQKKMFPFRYIPEYELQVLELPYKKFELSMLILLPKKTQDDSDSLLKVLFFSSVSDVHSHFETLTSNINRPSATYNLKLANRLYGEKTFSFLPEYLVSTLKLYHTELQAVDFIRAFDESRQLINKWVEEQTENKIKDLLKPGVVNELTRLALVNAIYFKGTWMHKFETRNTKEMPFKINQQNESRPVQMMFEQKKFPFRCIQEHKLQVLELPYVNEELSMLILLPNETQDGSDPLLKLESELTLDKLLDWTRRDKMATWMTIRVHLPKFKLEVESSLSEILQEMGMSSVFQETKADLTGMSSNGRLFISAVVHKAFIEQCLSSVMEDLSRANSLFALDLYRALSASNAEKNMFFSPLSISTALSMVYLGARGDTATEMAKVLSISSISDVHSHFKTLTSTINRPSATYILKLANRLYGEKTFSFLPEYLNSTLKLYHADLQTVDFIGASEESRKLINKWVEEQTENKIKDLLKRGIVTDLTRLVLVNAIYFKGTWMHRFETRDTEEMPFKINQNERRPVQMMYQKEMFPFRYIPEHELQVLELPYKQEELSMLILLPNETQDGSDPLLKLESELTLDKLLDWTEREKMGTSMDISVHLPKFKLEVDSSLSEILQEMGMSSVFQETKADLTGMSTQRRLLISAVAHKAFIEVNEEGTEAAAATAVMVELDCAFPCQSFIADHPFMFFIRHNPTNSILFLGRFRGPL
ncbi:leukocyte elastase inhibitor-like isoform X1 [Labeo rohita]|uniref:Leukocyte elastase inhibitor n=1 Tax=Labeo rohita TaxID=84645 RepID=A0A498N7L7_LABRO|nr:leukocyte elastase inhibitor-like isoform X1 [Labeo rohita]